MAMAIFAMAVMVGPAIGPTLGGYIVDNWTWSWIFYMNIPIGVVALVLVSKFVQEDDTLRAYNAALTVRERKHLDWQGIALPSVQLRLFRDIAFTSGTLIATVAFMILSASMFLLPVFMQDLLGFTAQQSGAGLFPRALAMLVFMPIAGRLYYRIDPRLAIGGGFILVAINSWDMSHLTLASGSPEIVWSIVLQGVGCSFVLVLVFTFSLASIPRHLLADATGLNSLLRQVGGAIGVAIFVTLLSDDAVIAREGLRAHVSVVDPVAQSRLAIGQAALVARGIPAKSASVGALAALQGSVTKQSLVLSFEKLFFLGGILFVLMLPLLGMLKVERTARMTEVPR